MKLAKIALAGSVALGLVPAVSGTAAAHPVKNGTLTDNRLYGAGPLPATDCRERPVKKMDVRSAKAYLNEILTCLTDSWTAELTQAGLKKSPVKLTYATKMPAKYCGAKWRKGDWDGYYCDASHTILIVLSKDLLEEPGDLYLFNLLATQYGEHVQNVSGIYRAWYKLDYRNKSELAEQTRRYNLQADCFAGASLRSVWKSFRRDREDWDDLLFYLRGWAGKYNGNRKSITYWANEGFKSGDPGACNTWTAPSSKVA
ncbi:neutral zinc metallopeptidase [Microbispora sp. NEAU-D428]|uniref:neutral zinc metallopeptidase n=1 Tax=Microbispora sitophila TaxID=2771537 RepID=UPI0018676736|nr:neutral zinc metallopeptidase [Microbispora sitophila]MBE3009159.1 neutral zinc metallopeptidase [Microbispora sitophila]